MSVAGLVVAAVALLAAVAFGLLRSRRLGRMRPAAGSAPAVTAAELGRPLGERATLLQFSSAFCRPCVATRQVLGSTAATLDGVEHVEVDAEANLDLVRRLGVSSTPTTVLLDRHGVERRRATGVPRRPELLTALADTVG